MRTEPVLIHGVRYFAAAEIAREMGLSRTTLWRWRREGKIPAGHRFRDGAVLFTKDEADAVIDFANRVEPIESHTIGQPALFGPDGRSRG